MTSLDGKVAIITGAVGNLGTTTARVFARSGAALALVDHRAGRLSEAFPELAQSPDDMLVPGVDLTDEGAVEGMVEQVASRLGRIDALVSTVGAYHGGAPVHEDDLAAWDRMLQVNLRTTLLCSRAVMPVMIEQGGGRIVTIGSRNALSGAAGTAAYSAAKGAVLRLTESLAKEGAEHGITANCVLPGTIDTPDNREAMPDADHDRWVPPEAIAEVIGFLVSDEAWAISGAAIPVYGRS